MLLCLVGSGTSCRREELFAMSQSDYVTGDGIVAMVVFQFTFGALKSPHNIMTSAEAGIPFNEL